MHQLTKTIIVFCLFVFIGCVATSPTKIVIPPSLKQKVQELLAKSGDRIWKNEELNQYFRNVAINIAPNLFANNNDLQFYIENTLKINAHALPDGTITLTSGLLMQLDDPNLIASVIAHELAHIALRHNQLASQQYQIALSRLRRIYGPTLRQEEIEALAQLVSLSYSRAQELEADKLGQQILIKAGYDNVSFSTTLRLLEELEPLYTDATNQDEGKDQTLESATEDIFSTHPAIDTRLQNIEQTSRQARQQFDTKEYRELLTRSAIYKSFGPATMQGNTIFLRELNLAISLAASGTFDDFTVDRGTAQIGGRKIKFQVILDENINQSLIGAIESIGFGYDYKLTDVHNNQPFQLIARSKINNSECLDLAFTPVAGGGILAWENRKQCSGSTGSPLELLSFETLSTKQIQIGFSYSLNYAEDNNITQTEIDQLNRSIGGTRTKSLFDWLNQNSKNNIRKILH